LRPGVNPEASGFHDLPLFRGAFLPAQDSSHSRHQLPRAERLNDIVIPADFQTQNAVHFLAFRREEYDRQGFQTVIGTKTLANGQAVFIRKKNIQQDYIRRVPPQIIEAIEPSPEALNLKSLFAEVVADKFYDVFLVFDDYNSWSHNRIIAPPRLQECFLPDTFHRQGYGE
jgi:hypothetical protein